MARTTETLVRQIIEIDTNITDLSPFIDAAHSLVEAQCEDIEEDNATEVETWLAAHFVTIRDMRVNREDVSGVGQSYMFKIDLGLSCSMYGQTAMNLDATGGLSRWNQQVIQGNARKTVGVSWLGTESS